MDADDGNEEQLEAAHYSLFLFAALKLSGPVLDALKSFNFGTT